MHFHILVDVFFFDNMNYVAELFIPQVLWLSRFFEKKLDFKMLNAYNVFCQSARGREPRRLMDAEVAQLVEHHLAMVGVASSSLVFRSNMRK